MTVETMKTGVIIAVIVIVILIIIVSVSILTPKLSPADFTYKTDQYPPHYFQEQNLDGSVVMKGIAFDIIRMIAKDMGSEVRDDQFKIITWSEAVQDTLLFNKTMLVGAYRTPVREHLYKWVGPVVTDRAIVFTKQGSNIRITKPDELKKYKIGVVTDYTQYSQLKALGVVESKIILDSNFDRILDRLDNGDVDLIAFGEYPAYFAAKEMKGSSSIIVPVYTLDSADLWFAFNRDTPDSFISSFQSKLDGMRQSGEYQKIVDSYIG